MSVFEDHLSVWLEDLPSDVSGCKVHEEDMDVLKFKYRDVVAIVNDGNTSDGPWATVYRIEAVHDKQGARDAIYLLKALKKHYEAHGYDFAYSFAETAFIKHILYKSKVETREK